MFVYCAKSFVKSCVHRIQPSLRVRKDCEQKWAEGLTFLRLVFTMNSRARCCIGAGSRGRKTMLLSRGSPGTMAQWSNTERQKAWPCVWYRKSVSKPKDSITGKNAWKAIMGKRNIRNWVYHAFIYYKFTHKNKTPLSRSKIFDCEMNKGILTLESNVLLFSDSMQIADPLQLRRKHPIYCTQL